MNTRHSTHRDPEMHRLAFEGMKYFQEMSPLERMTVLADVLQDNKDKLYEATAYQVSPLYKERESVVVLSQLYYNAFITKVTSLHCPDLDKMVPSYEIQYRNYKKSREGSIDIVMEYDITPLTGPNYRDEELLLAHYWNVVKLQEPKARRKLCRVGIFRLDESKVTEVEKSWQEKRTPLLQHSARWTFAKWIGIE